jgi:hypothetical protein
MAGDLTLWSLILLLLAGGAIGLAGGLLGIGGSVIALPALLEIFAHLPVPERLLATGFALCLFGIAGRLVWRAVQGG